MHPLGQGLRKKVFLSLFYLGAFGIGFLGSFLYLHFSSVFVKTPSFRQEQKRDDLELPSKDNFTVLFIGYGGQGHDGGNLSDVIIVAHFNVNEKKVALISVPRDLWVKIPVRSDATQNFKINHAYAIGLDDKNYPLKEPQYKGDGGGGEIAKKVVGDVVGVRIDYFIAVDFEGFKKIVDTLDGIEVEVPVTFDDYFYPVKGLENETCGFSAEQIAEFHRKYTGFELEKQFICRYEHIHFEKGKNHMNGEEVLKFVRSRHSDQHGGDFARSERQQAVLLALKEKLVSLDALRNIDELFNRFADMVRTDLDLEAIKKLIGSIGRVEDYKISFISLTDKNVLVSGRSSDGQFILLPREGEGRYEGIKEYIRLELEKTVD